MYTAVNSSMDTVVNSSMDTVVNSSKHKHAFNNRKVPVKTIRIHY